MKAGGINNSLVSSVLYNDTGEEREESFIEPFLKV